MEKELLSTEEVYELIDRAHAGDTAARDKIVEHNMRLVASIASKFNTSNLMSFEDLQQEGFFGLIKAIDKFDTTKGYRFSTYATWWIKQAVQRAISDNNRLIRVPVHIQEDLQRVKKAKMFLEQELGHEPTVDEVYEKIKIDIDWYDKIVGHEFFCIIADMMTSGDYTIYDPDILDIEGAIMEDFEFNEDAELILKKIVKYMAMNQVVPNKETTLGKVSLSKERIMEIFSYDGGVASLDQRVSDESDSCLGDSIKSDLSVEDEYDKKCLEQGLERAIDEVYGTQVKEILSNISKYEVQIEYLKSKLGKKNLDVSSEIVALEENESMDENKKLYIKEILATIVRESASTSAISVNFQTYIDDLVDKKSKIEKKSTIPKAELIKRRFGICGYEKETLEQLGKRYNVSRERIRQIEKKIIGGEDSRSRLLAEKILEYCNLSKEDFS